MASAPTEEPTRGMGDNQPPLADQAKIAIEEQLAEYKPRLEQLTESLGRAKADTPENAGKCADLIKAFKKLKTKIDNVRKDVGEPYSEAVKVVNAGPKPMVSVIEEAEVKLRRMLADFDAKQREEEARQRREREAREAEEAARLAEVRRKEQEAAAAAGATAPEPEPEPEPEAVRRETPAPVVAGDYGATAHRRVTKVPVIVDVYALPEDVLNAPRVQEAILQVVRAMRVGNPDIEIPGIKIEEQTSLAIR